MCSFRYFRYVLAGIAFYCMVVVNLTRSDFNVTILKMIGNCSDANSSSTTQFCWSKGVEELLVSSYFIGYTLQLPGGILVSKLGAYLACSLPLLLTIILAFLTPLAATHWWLLLILRIVQGAGAAPSFPAMSALWAKWAPRTERSTLFSLTVAGHFVGAALANTLSGYLSDHGTILGGSWQSVFMLYGILGSVWFVLWMVFVTSDPDRNIWTSLDEKDYISLHRAPPLPKSSIPWLWVFTSVRCWAIYIAHVCSYVGYTTMLIGYPQYLWDVHHMDLDKVGYISSIPIIAMFISSVIVGKVTDTLITRRIWSITAARKINTAIGMFIPAVINVIMAFQDMSLEVIITLLTIQNAANGFVLSGFQVNYIDICPDHAGILSGLGNSFASLAGIMVPLLLYRFNPDRSNAQLEWSYMFVTAGVVMAVGGAVYCTLGTADRQIVRDRVVTTRTDDTAECTTNIQSGYVEEEGEGEEGGDVLNQSMLGDQEDISKGGDERTPLITPFSGSGKQSARKSDYTKLD